eukprot:gene23908-30186_t
MPIDHLIRYIGESRFERLTDDDKVEDMEHKAKCADQAGRAVQVGEYTVQYINCTAEEHQKKFYDGDKSIFHAIAEKMKDITLDNTSCDRLDWKQINIDIGEGKVQQDPHGLRRHPVDHDVFLSSKLWYNELFPYKKMAKHMRFPYCDTRDEVKWRHVTNEEYCSHGEQGARNTMDYVARQKRLKQPVNPKYDGSHKGRHNVCPLMKADLEAFGFDNVGFDIMHHVGNVMKNHISVLKSERAASDADRKYAVATGKVPALEYKNGLTFYQLRNDEEKIFDAVINSVLVSPVYKRDFCIKYPFQQTSFLKSHECEVLMLVYMSYALSFTGVHDNYKEFYARYAYDLKCIMDPCLDAETLQDKYIPSIYETRIAYFRLYKAFEDNDKYQDKDGKMFEGFTSWVSGLNKIYLACGENMSSCASLPHYVNNILHTKIYDYDEICDGAVYFSDFLTLKDSILNFNPVVYKKLITKGILFNCRGHHYGALDGLVSEGKCLERTPADLLNVWHRRNQYSSFFRCTDFEAVVDGVVNDRQRTTSSKVLAKKVPSKVTGKARFKRTAETLSDDEADRERTYHEVTKFGQINSCWRVDMPGDNLVNGLAFANVTFRKVKYDNERRHFHLDATSLQNLGVAQKFICVNYIDSTSVAVSPVATYQVRTDSGRLKTKLKPMLKPDGVQSFILYSKVSSASKDCYAPREARLHALYLLELHPERVSFRYGNILEDTDGTKLWEHK